MINYAYYDNTGRYVQTGIAPEEITEFDIPAGCRVYYGKVDIFTQYHNVATDTPVDKSAAPSDDYKFDYSTKTWVLNTDLVLNRVRYQRQQLLEASDWTDTLSAKNRLGDDLYNQWQVYRQALRDLTAQTEYPINVVWPTPPQ